MRILDLSAGNRAVWFNKKHPLATYIDIRPEVGPDLVADSRALPDAIEGTYDLFVFDPPHIQMGRTSNMAKVYGHHTTDEIREIIRSTAKESHRVGHEKSLMAFKWNDHDLKLASVLNIMDQWWEPLFGHLTRNGPSAPSQTYWVMLRRRC